MLTKDLLVCDDNDDCDYAKGGLFTTQKARCTTAGACMKYSQCATPFHTVNYMIHCLYRNLSVIAMYVMWL